MPNYEQTYQKYLLILIQLLNFHIQLDQAVNYNFVNECKEAGISDLSSQQSVARMVLIARKIGMEESEAQLIQRFNRTIAEEKMVAKKLENEATRTEWTH